MLATLLDSEIKRRKITVRQAAAEMGLSHTTIYDVMKHRPLQVVTANTICKWLGVSITTALDEPACNDTTAAAISVILRHVPELATTFIEAAEAMEKGTMAPEDLLAVIEFMAYQIHKRKEALVLNERPAAIGEESARNN